MTTLLAELALVPLRVAEQIPDDEDVTAGWTAFAVFLLLILAVAFLGFSLSKHLRKAQANEEAGLFGPDRPTDGTSKSQPESHQAP